MGLRLLSTPTPVITLERAMEQLRILDGLLPEEKSFIESTVIPAATGRVEQEISSVLGSQQWSLSLDSFEACISMPLYPLVSVEEIRYVNDAGVITTLDPAMYRVDSNSRPGRLTPTHNERWPTTQAVTSAVEIDFTAGHAVVPPALISAVLLLCGTLYENRETLVTGTITTKLPHNVEWLMEPYREQLL